MNIYNAPLDLFPTLAAAPGKQDGETGFQDFRMLLAGLSQEHQVALERAADLQPEIGSQPARFEERPMVLLSAVDLSQALAAAPEQPATGQHHDAASPMQDRVAQLARPLEDWLARLAAEPEAQPVMHRQPQAGTGKSSAPSGILPAGATNVVEAPKAQGQAIGTAPAPLAQRSAPAESGSRPAPVPAASQDALRSAAQSPFSALLLAQEDGLRLVVKVPALSQPEREKLEIRIARMFAERGLPLAEMQIYQPGMAQIQGTA